MTRAQRDARWPRLRRWTSPLAICLYINLYASLTLLLLPSSHFSSVTWSPLTGHQVFGESALRVTGLVLFVLAVAGVIARWCCWDVLLPFLLRLTAAVWLGFGGIFLAALTKPEGGPWPWAFSVIVAMIHLWAARHRPDDIPW